MYDWLNPKDGPVIVGLEREQLTLAKNQPEYRMLRVLQGMPPEYRTISRWELTPAQRKIIADGGDIFLEMLTFGHPPMPVNLAVSDGNIPVEWVRTVLLGKAPSNGSATEG